MSRTWRSSRRLQAQAEQAFNIGYANQLGEEDVWRVIQDVQQTCHIDGNCLYLTGHSMGGGGTLHLGMLHADRFAAIAAVSTWSNLSHAENAHSLPVKLCHGAADPLFSVELPRALFKQLRELGYRVEYEEYPGVGHNAGDQAYREAASSPGSPNSSAIQTPGAYSTP